MGFIDQTPMIDLILGEFHPPDVLAGETNPLVMRYASPSRRPIDQGLRTYEAFAKPDPSRN